MSAYTYWQLGTYYATGATDTALLRRLMNTIGVHCLVDLPLAQNELILHHLLVFGLVALQEYHFSFVGAPPPHMATSVAVFCAPELSTLFYVIRIMYDKYFSGNNGNNPWFMQVNDVCFMASFVGTRGVLLFTQVVANPAYYDVLYHFAWIATPVHTGGIFNMALTAAQHSVTWGFFGLNLYWCSLLLKKAAKMCGARGSTDEARTSKRRWTESLVKWGGVAQLGIALYHYKSGVYTALLDVTGIALLAVSTFWYHSTLEDELSKTTTQWNLDVLQDTVLDSYAVDIAMIHVRVPMYLASLTFTRMPNHVLAWTAWVGCSVLHGCGLYQYIEFLLEMHARGDTFLLEEPEEGHYKTEIISILMGWPVGWSTVFLMVLSGSVEYAAAKATVYVLLCLAMWVRPLYDYNHLYVHLLLLVQTWIMCSVNNAFGEQYLRL